MRENVYLTYIKVFLNNESVCDFMVVQLFKLSTKDNSMYVQQIQVGYQICIVWSYLTHIDAIIYFSKIVYPCCLSSISSCFFFSDPD